MIISQLSDIFCMILIMSLSGSALILLFFALKPLIRHRLSKSVQYFLWFVTLAALLVPISKLIALPEAPSKVVLAPIHAIAEQYNPASEEVTNITPQTNTMKDPQTDTAAMPDVKRAPNTVFISTSIFVTAYFLIVLVVLIYTIISYIRFTKKIRQHRTRAHMEEVYVLVGLCGDAIAPRLYRCALATTPMLVGVLKPEIILPDLEYTDAQLQNIFKHELTHLRRRDVVVKWLSAVACALHWFNPLVWLARREIDRICELSCDEVVIRTLDTGGKQNYGDTLISVAADTEAPRTTLSTTMCEEKEVLKERLNAIMKYQKRTWVTMVISTVIIILAFCIICVLGAGAMKPSAAIDNKTVLTGISPQSTQLSSTPARGEDMTYVTEAASVQSFFPLPSPAATPDPEYLNQLRQNATEVNTKKEFTDALNSAYVIVLKKDITIDDEFVTLENINALVIDEGVTLTVTCLNLDAKCKIVNLGEIIVADDGRLFFFSEPDYSTIGKISVKGKDAKIEYYGGKVGAEEIAYYLSDDSLFNELSLAPPYRDGETIEILVDQDIEIAAGKTLWLNAHSVLHVAEGVTLTNNGTIRYYIKPIIEGKIEGTGKVVYDD